MDERCRTWLVPKMIVQPLAENYFKHAFDRQGEEGRLRIRAALLPAEDSRRGESWLEITVEDNGGGMDEAELIDIMNAVAQDRSERAASRKIGLVNLFKRLVLYYGDAAKYSVDNRPGIGMRIRLILPEALKETGASLSYSAGGGCE
jgi:two-component system sensor histidine kinase YesM